ncbi:hypothetical protein [Sulfitobacter profundi]|uniref:Uncharacterized protein n=1 Tax=Sulfitobacter profundi TaxID=2679961 RepID=A0ABW1Z3C1_9RHOB
MTDISEREACTKRCWWLGAGAGLLVAFLLLAFGIWGLLMSIVAGVLVALIVGYLALTLLCKDVPAAAPKTARAARRLHRSQGLQRHREAFLLLWVQSPRGTPGSGRRARQARRLNPLKKHRHRSRQRPWPIPLPLRRHRNRSPRRKKQLL